MSTSSILLIDDDCDLLLVIGERCRQLGLHVRCAHNLLTAFTMVETQVPDLICIDVRMPTGNGLRFCEMLADSPETAQIPIIVLTGRRDAATIQACEQIEAHYLAKQPDVWGQLRPLIERLLSKHGHPMPQPDGAPADDTRPACPDEHPAPASPASSEVRPRTVVVADDEPDVVELLSERFTQLGCSVISAGSALEAINVIYHTLPDLVCIDVSMPTGNGLSVCEMMASDGLLRCTPTIVLTGKSDKETIVRCHDLMVYYVQKGGDIWGRVEPLARELLGFVAEHPAAKHTDPPASQPGASGDAPAAERAAGSVATITAAALEAASSPTGPEEADETLLDAVFAILGARGEDGDGGEPDEVAAAGEAASEPPWVLCIDDDADFSLALKCRLESCGVAVIRAYSGMEGYRMALTRPASAILLDYTMPDGQGDYILGRLQDNPVTQQIPVIVVTGNSDAMLRRRMLNMGAKEFFTKPVDFLRLRDALAKHIDILAEPVGSA